MARKFIILDDLNNEPNAEPVRLGINGEWREIDLAEENNERLRASLDEFWNAARKVTDAKPAGRKARPANRFTRPNEPVATPVAGNGGSNGAHKSRTPKPGDKRLNAAIREWAKSEGIQVADRGRLPEDVVQRYLVEGLGSPVKNAAEAPAQPAGASTPKKAAGGRKSSMPPAEEVQGVLSQVGTAKGVAEHFKVSIGTARKWIKDAQEVLDPVS